MLARSADSVCDSAARGVAGASPASVEGDAGERGDGVVGEGLAAVVPCVVTVHTSLGAFANAERWSGRFGTPHTRSLSRLCKLEVRLLPFSEDCFCHSVLPGFEPSSTNAGRCGSPNSCVLLPLPGSESDPSHEELWSPLLGVELSNICPEEEL